MAVSTEPNEIICYMLRSEVTEPTRTTVTPTTRMTSATHNATGNGVATTFTVTNTPMCCVDSVTVAAATQTEYVNYTVDIVNSQVIFATAPANLAAIVITYKYGSNWIYPDEPRDDLGANSYPRIMVLPIDENEIQKQGLADTDTYDSTLIQIDVLAYKNGICTIGGVNMEGAQVSAVLARAVVNKLRRQTESRIGNKLFQPRILSKRPAPYEEDNGIYRHIIELRLDAFNIGE